MPQSIYATTYHSVSAWPLCEQTGRGHSNSASHWQAHLKWREGVELGGGGEEQTSEGVGPGGCFHRQSGFAQFTVSEIGAVS